MINNAMFSSNRDDWETPLELFNQLDAIYHFDLDVCALPHNAKCDKYYTPDDDGLSKPWEGTCWMSPPYGRQIGRWMEKAYKSSLVGATVVCLVPSRTDTAWWHDYAGIKNHIHTRPYQICWCKTRGAIPVCNCCFCPTHQPRGVADRGKGGMRFAIMATTGIIL